MNEASGRMKSRFRDRGPLGWIHIEQFLGGHNILFPVLYNANPPNIYVSISGFKDDGKDGVDFGFEDGCRFDSNLDHVSVWRQERQHFELARQPQQRHVQLHFRQTTSDARPNAVTERNPSETGILQKGWG